MNFMTRLQDPHPLFMVELRPPRRNVSAQESMDSWIDLNHTVRRLIDDDIQPLWGGEIKQARVNFRVELKFTESDFSQLSKVVSQAHAMQLFVLEINGHALKDTTRFFG